MPANSPAKKTAARRSDKPAPVGFNFDTWSRGDDIEPFTVVIDGKRYESLDPFELDFRALNALLDQPEMLFRELFPDDADAILGNKIRLGALAQFVEAIASHFGLQDFIAAQS